MVILLTVGGIFCVFFLSRSLFIDSADNKDICRTITPESEEKASENAEIIIRDLILKEIEKQKGLQVIINADEGKIIHSDDKIQCKSIHCSLCNKNKQIAELTASDAIINKATKNIFLNGNAIVHFDDITINSQEVYYSYSSQQLSTTRQTEYEHPNFKLLAQQSTIDFKKSEIKMSGGVQSVFSNCPTENSD